MNIQNEIITIVDLSTIAEWTLSMSLLLLGIINIIIQFLMCHVSVG